MTMIVRPGRRRWIEQQLYLRDRCNTSQGQKKRLSTTYPITGCRCKFQFDGRIATGSINFLPSTGIRWPFSFLLPSSSPFPPSSQHMIFRTVKSAQANRFAEKFAEKFYLPRHVIIQVPVGRLLSVCQSQTHMPLKRHR